MQFDADSHSHAVADRAKHGAIIKVFGIGGCGGNAVNHMVNHHVDGIEFIGLNTDAQALADVLAHHTIQLGGQLTRGLGAGANPEVGRQAAIEDRETLRSLLVDTDLVFIMAGMGGGTGTGASPVVAEIAREMGILTVAVVTRPFPFEGHKRLAIAEQGIQALQKQVDSLIVIPNDKLLAVLGKSTSLLDAFKAANDVLLGAVKGIADLITCPGIINVDFADVRTVMANRGIAIMGTASAQGENRAKEATERAIRSPLMEDADFHGAKSILVNITAGLDFSLGEFSDVGSAVEQFASDAAMIVVGTVIDTNLSDEIRVTLVATGLGDDKTRGAHRFDAQFTHVSPAIVRSTPDSVSSSVQAQALSPTDTATLEHSDERANPLNSSESAPASNSMSDTARVLESLSEKELDVPTFLRRGPDYYSSP
ncbi:cell division protein FtsZ [Aestuariibacter sp. AA17]|uniref:Cell division protein FtsZ n=1 Tax=Fluctibacter corallii TaxID=2984329 RepID=A0ABT3A3Q4_9ALTE|nr:cell division protein FtsZ [Aestuariibacter sp. AA17]MCV2883317.1 cell division protein FtsZ [Aestuariibacter sp. AA17]